MNANSLTAVLFNLFHLRITYNQFRENADGKTDYLPSAFNLFPLTCFNYNKLVSDWVTTNRQEGHWLKSSENPRSHQHSHSLSSFMRLLMWNRRELVLCCRWRLWLIVLMHFGYNWHAVYGAVTIMSGAKRQQPAFTCNFSSDSPASLLSLPASVCIVCLVKAVRVWHGQTRTKWIHWWGESGSEETERGREQALQYGPGENCTGTLQYVIL